MQALRSLSKSGNKRLLLSHLKDVATGTTSRALQPSRLALGRLTFRRCLTEVQMPALSPTMTEGVLAEWKKKEGEELVPGDVLCSVETDKATMDFEYQDDAILAKIIVQSGPDVVKVGTVIAFAAESEEEYKEFLASGSSVPSSSQPSTSVPQPESSEKSSEIAKDEPASAGGKAKIKFIGKRSAQTGTTSSSHSPDWMVDWSKPSQTSTGAEASKESTPAPAAASAPSAAPSSGYKDIPLSNMRKIIAKRLTESKATVPHHYASVDVELDGIMKLRKDLKKNGVNVSVNDLLIKCAALALRDVPEVNRVWDSSKKTPVPNKTVDISVAVATDAGLITPIVKDADRKGLFQINSDFKDLVARARANKLKPEEFQGGSFSISNLGGFGVDFFSAVINPPQACILAVGGGRKVLVAPKGGEENAPPVLSNVMTVQLSSDRRVVDETVSGQFLQVFQAYMNNPVLLVV